MPDDSYSIFQLLKEDPRYSIEAYQFVREALSFGQHVMGLGTEHDSSVGVEPAPEEAEGGVEKHLTGQELCESIRRYALEQYGYMAKVVLNSWGVTGTGDFGEMVYNLIRIGAMKKSPNDRREDFDDVYDFDEAFKEVFKLEMPE
jgi:uncharacterized repeat protein (TIGR04138 family)